MYLIDYHYLIQSISYCICRPVKWYVSMDVTFQRENPDGTDRTTLAYFQSTPVVMMNQTQTSAHMEDAVSRIENRVETFTTDGSGWTIQHIGNVTLHVATYDPIGGSSFIPTPRWIALKKATVNIQNKDDNLLFSLFGFSCVSSTGETCSTCY